MCGRSSLTINEQELEERFGSTFYSDELERYNPLPNFNIAPTHYLPVIPMDEPEHFRIMRWGLVPFWAKDDKIGSKMINARIETVMEKPAFRKSLEQRRCLVPLDGYYEWMKSGKQKIPFRITRPDEKVFAVAGMYEKWKQPDGQYLWTFTLITQPAGPSIDHIHDRMPAILGKDQEQTWIDPTLSPAQALELLHPPGGDEIKFYKVSDAVNKVVNNNPELIKPVSDEQVDQLKLF
jgi:putative SOS response-associated peptidase YedK